MHQLWLLLLAGLLAQAGKVLSDGQDPDWWKKTVVYQIYPRSFQDSDGDGIGDLKGIQSRLPYFDFLGVETLWLSPIYKSPFKDFGYDISDHKDIDPIFGTMQDFDDLLEAVHQRGMYLVMDFIPNHTSDKHPWFIESCKGSDNPYSDWYRWADPKILEDGTRAPPNNWLSVFGHSAWEWNEHRQQYYLHQFVPEQPDLNFRNPEVKEAMEDVLRFWAEKGVDGFRVDAIQTMFEVEDLSLDEPRSFREGVGPEEHLYLDHIYTTDQPEIHTITKDWRNKVFKPIDKRTGKHTFMIMEAYNPEKPEELMKYYHSGADMPFNFNLIFANKECGGTCFKGLIDSWMDFMPPKKWPNFVLGNHDQRRISTRKGPKFINALNIMLLTLPGTPTTYYGEELGLNDIKLTYDQTQDPWGVMAGPELYEKYSRDPERAPMQWDSSKNAGFSTAEQTWLPVNPDFPDINVDAQMNQPLSPLDIYAKAIQIRRRKSFQNNQMHYHVVDNDVISYIRGSEALGQYLIILNLGQSDIERKDFSLDDSCQGRIILNTGNFGNFHEYPVGKTIDLESVSLKSGQGLVLEIVRVFDKSEL